jgi:hypothetical protein
MMHRFSRSTSSDMTSMSLELSTASSLWDMLRRRLNKLLGRPATPEIGIMAEMISEILHHLQNKVSDSVTQAVITIPNLFAYNNVDRQQFQSDLDEASTYAGLESILTPSWLSAASAAAAGQNWGLCEHYDDILACGEEEESLPQETVLAVDYTRDALVVTLFPFKSAWSNSDEMTELFYDVGAVQEQKEGHWKRVTNAVQKLPLERPATKITRVIVTGDAAESEQFLDTLKEAMKNLNYDSTVFKQYMETYNPLFLCSRGAAEMAKRKQEAPGACIECDKCKKLRKELKQGYEKDSHILKGPIEQFEL